VAEECLFCKIVAGDVPSTRVHEDDRVIAIMDIFPATRGHVLVIPRAHAEDIHSADPADVAAVAQTAQIMAGRVSGARRSHRCQQAGTRIDRIHPALVQHECGEKRLNE